MSNLFAKSLAESWYISISKSIGLNFWEVLKLTMSHYFTVVFSLLIMVSSNVIALIYAKQIEIETNEDCPFLHPMSSLTSPYLSPHMYNDGYLL